MPSLLSKGNAYWSLGVHWPGQYQHDVHFFGNEIHVYSLSCTINDIYKTYFMSLTGRQVL